MGNSRPVHTKVTSAATASETEHDCPISLWRAWTGDVIICGVQPDLPPPAVIFQETGFPESPSLVLNSHKRFTEQASVFPLSLWLAALTVVLAPASSA